MGTERHLVRRDELAALRREPHRRMRGTILTTEDTETTERGRDEDRRDAEDDAKTR